eukprot:COSAG02_NODE_1145_length_14241_cov_3.363951_5_plen_55_part_00
MVHRALHSSLRGVPDPPLPIEGWPRDPSFFSATAHIVSQYNSTVEKKGNPDPAD